MRSPLRVAMVVVLALHVACGGGGNVGSPPPPQQKPPNIVFILTDDLDADSVSTMTRVQALIGDQGLRFERHFVSLSLCCPSRISGLRGQYSHNTGIYTNGLSGGGFAGIYARGLEASTFATWLQAAGYRTALFGKYLNGYPDTAPSDTYIPPGWSEWFAPVAGSPYSGSNYTLNENGSKVVHGDQPEDYLTDVLSAKLTDFIRRSVADQPDRPFFAYVAPYAPHGPAIPAPRHAQAYPGATAPKGGSFNEADVSDKPAWVQALPLLDASQIAHIDTLYRRRLQTLLAVDEMVGALVDTLQGLGQLDNTFLVFASDNGFHQGQHRLEQGKATGFEEDLRVPLLVRGPGVPKGGRVRLLTANVDYAATFAAIAGASVPDWVDGRSLLPLLQGRSPSPWRQALLLEYKPAAPDFSQQALAGTLEPPDPQEVRTRAAAVDSPFQGLRLATEGSYIAYGSGEFELYDLAADPAQLLNIYPQAAPARRQQLATWLGRLSNASGAALRQAEETQP